jgi:flagellar hook assembly protein FlgD
MTGWAAGENILIKTTNGGELITAIQSITSAEFPDKYSLSQNYPNPFNPVTKIKFDIPLDSRLRGNDNVTLKIYDILGREIATLVNEGLQPGTYDVEWDGTNYCSGVYFYVLITAEYSETKKMVLIK